MTRARATRGVLLVQGILLAALTVLAAQSVQAQVSDYVVSPNPNQAEGNTDTIWRVSFIRHARLANTMATPRVQIMHITTNDADFTSPTEFDTTFQVGMTFHTVPITIRGDTVVEPDETFRVRLLSTTGGAVLAESSIVTILNDDSPLSISGPASIQETDANFNSAPYTITRDSAFPNSQAITWSIQHTGTTDADFTATSGTVMFTGTESTATFTIPIAGDELTESDEIFRIALSAGTHRAPAPFAVTLNDDDVAADTAPAFADGVAPPGQTYTVGAPITALTLPQATGGDGGLTYALTPDVATAVPGLAFDANTRIVSGTPTAMAVAVTLTYIAGDADSNVAVSDTDTLTFSVTVQAAASNPAGSATLAATGNNGDRDPDTPGLQVDEGDVITLTVTYHGRLPGSFARVSGTVSGTAIHVLADSSSPSSPGAGDLRGTRNGLPYVRFTNNLALPTGVELASDTVTVIDDSMPEGDETIVYTLDDLRWLPPPSGLGPTNMRIGTPNSVTITIRANDGFVPDFGAQMADDQTYNAGAAITALTLPEATGGIAPLAYSISPTVGTVVPGLAFASGTRVLSGTPTTEAGAVALTYTVRDANGNTDTLTFRATVQPAASNPAGTITLAATGNNGDRDPVAPGLQVDEGDSITLTATFHGKTGGSVAARLAITGNAIFQRLGDTGGDVDSQSNTGLVTLVANAGADSDFRVFPVIDDTVPEDDETITFSLTNLIQPTASTPSTWTRGTPDSVTITIRANDAVTPGIAISPTALTVFEDSSTAYTVALMTEPAGDVTITPGATPAGHGLTLTPGALTFTSGNWNSAQTITVAAAEDADATDDTATITHAVTGYGSVTADPVTITITDNDDPGVTITPTALTVPEGGTRTYDVALDVLPSGNVVITPMWVNLGDTNVATFSPTALTFTPANWNSAQMVSVTGVEDADDVADGPVTLTHMAVGGGYGTARSELEGVVIPATGVDIDSVVVTVAEAAAGVTITPATLSVTEGGSGAYTVVLDTLPGGEVTITPGIAPDGHDLTLTPTTGGALTFTAANWNSAQTITVAAAEDGDTVDDTATITHAVTGYGSVTADPVTVTITDTTDPDTAPAFAAGDAPPAQTYTVGAITALTLPEATGGNGMLAYALAPDAGTAVPGLAFDANTRIVSGTPTTMAGAVTLTYTAGDADANTAASDTATLTFSVTVQVAPAVTISPTALTVAEGDSGTYTVVLTTDPGVPVTITPGIAPDGHDLTLTPGGALTFTAANWNSAQVVTVAAAEDSDSVDDAATITHAVTGYGSVTANPVTVTITDTTVPDTAPAFAAGVAPPAQTYTAGAAITLTLPPATGGNGALTYALAPAVATAVPGLAFDANTRIVSGTPTTMADAVTLTYTAGDADANTGASDTATLTFSVTVQPAPIVGTPAVTISPTTLTVAEGGTAIYTVVLTTAPGVPVTITPGIAPDGHDLTLTTGGALTFTAANWNSAQVVTVAAAQDTDNVDDAATITHAVTGYGSVTADPVTVTVTDNAPDFGAARVENQRYNVDTPITPLTLPTASGGEGTLSHVLTGNLPAGLTLPSGTLTLTGTPTAETLAVRLTWTATDAESQQTSLTFTLTVVDDADKVQRAALNRVILPEVARAMADDRVSAIARRIRQAGADSVEAGQTLTLGGQSTLAGVLTTHGRALAEGAFDLKTLLGGSDFVLPLNAREVAPGTGLSSVTLWGGGDYRAFSGKGGAINWDGNMFSAHLGADARLRDDLLAGVAVSWSEADLDYLDSADDGSGDYEVGLTSVHPYVGWTALGGRLDVWATVGYGWGELDITADDDTNDQRATSDVTMQTIGAGGSAQVFDGRAATLRIKGEALQTSMDVEGSEDITAVRIGARRLRLGLEASRTHLLAGGGQLVPTLEVGMRHDAGDGRTGTGAEVGGGMRYTDAANGLTVESHGRVLLGHSGDYQDWGVGGVVRLAAGQDGHGLSFSLQPTWGAAASRASQVWAREAAATVAAASTPVRQNGRVAMQMGYGLGWGDEALITPYGQVTLTNIQMRTYRLGSRMRLGDRLLLNLEGTRQETAAQPVDHGVLLQLGLNF